MSPPSTRCAAAAAASEPHQSELYCNCKPSNQSFVCICLLTAVVAHYLISLMSG